MNDHVKRGAGMFNKGALQAQQQGMPGQPPPLNVDIESCPDVLCPECKGRLWKFSSMVKKVPVLLSGGTGPDRIFLQCMVCDNPACGHILKPEEWEAIK